MKTNSISNNAARYKIKLQPIGNKIESDAEQSILEAVRLSGIEIIALCGGVGACDSCRIRVLSGIVSKPTYLEQEEFSEVELHEGFRLACQVNALSDLVIEIPAESLSTPQRLQIEGQQFKIEPFPAIRTIQLQIPKPSLADLRSDASRILDEAYKNIGESALEIDYAVLQNISSVLRENHWSISSVLHSNLIIALLPMGTPLYGLAVDIGTTKIAAYLVDLNSGKIVAKGGRMNPQISFGEDVITRIAYAKTAAQGRNVLQSRLVDEINDLVDTLIHTARDDAHHIRNEQIVDAVFVGNTAMHHLFAGLPVDQLGSSPYVAAVSESIFIPARELGLHIAPGAQVYLPPVVAGYVGSDHIAMLLSTDIPNIDETSLALDIGTNTEITLSHKGNLYSCSCASGPAFEGAHIQAGMRAAQGAIERIKIEGGEIYCYTIGSVPPIGICGSGILDAVSELLMSGVLDRRGGFHDEDGRIIQSDHGPAFMLVSRDRSGNGQPIFITRKDITEIQLAKGAIRTGIEILLKEAGIDAKQIQKFLIAGAFGTYLEIHSAVKVGMFPELPNERYQQIGNAAGAGAVMLLLSEQLRRTIETITKRIKYIELSDHPQFMSEFSKSLYFENALATRH